jgi:hypothetical protein
VRKFSLFSPTQRSFRDIQLIENDDDDDDNEDDAEREVTYNAEQKEHFAMMMIEDF